jgi:hypothetical protein
MWFDYTTNQRHSSQQQLAALPVICMQFLNYKQNRSLQAFAPFNSFCQHPDLVLVGQKQSHTHTCPTAWAAPARAGRLRCSHQPAQQPARERRLCNVCRARLRAGLGSACPGRSLPKAHGLGRLGTRFSGRAAEMASAPSRRPLASHGAAFQAARRPARMPQLQVQVQVENC